MVILAGVALSGFIWVIWHFDVYVGPSSVLPRDNLHHHFPIFLYAVRYIRLLGAFPDWFFTYDGGLWMEVLSNNFLLLMPHHLLGIAFAAVTGASPNLIYKLSLILGQSVFVVGCGWGIRPLVESRWIRSLGLVTLVLSSVFLTAQHQEQVLGSLFYLPWIWGGLLRLRRSPNYLFLICALVGLSLNAHYPQIQVLYWLGMMLGCALKGRASFREVGFALKAVWKFGKLKYLLLCGFALSVSLAPVLRTATFQDDLESPYRWQRGGIASESFAEYLEKNAGAKWNVHPQNLLLFGNFFDGKRVNLEVLDDSVFHFGPAVVVLLSLLLLRVRYRWFHLTAIAVFSVLSLGTYGPAPRVLWQVFPGIDIFRQWYHFTLLLDLHLAVAFFFVLEAAANHFRNKEFLRVDVLGVSLAVVAATGKVDPLYCLPPALLMMVGTAMQRRGRGLSVAVLGATLWTLGVGLAGANRIVQSYSKSLIPYSTLYYGALEDADALSKLFGTYREQVVRPRGMENIFVRELALRELFYWVDAKEGLVPFDKNAYSYRLFDGQIELNIQSRPLDAQKILFSQFSDGNWRVAVDGIPAGVGVGYQKLVTFQAASANIRISRTPSPWKWMIFAMWLPLLTFILSGIPNPSRTWRPSFLKKVYQ